MIEKQESTDVALKILDYSNYHLKTFPWRKEDFKEVSYSRFTAKELAKLILENEDEDYEVIFLDFIEKTKRFTHMGSWETKKMFAIMQRTAEDLFYYINEPLPYY